MSVFKTVDPSKQKSFSEYFKCFLLTTFWGKISRTATQTTLQHLCPDSVNTEHLKSELKNHLVEFEQVKYWKNQGIFICHDFGGLSDLQLWILSWSWQDTDLIGYSPNFLWLLLSFGTSISNLRHTERKTVLHVPLSCASPEQDIHFISQSVQIQIHLRESLFYK